MVGGVGWLGAHRGGGGIWPQCCPSERGDDGGQRTFVGRGEPAHARQAPPGWVCGVWKAAGGPRGGETPRVWRCQVAGAGEEGDHTGVPGQPPCPPLLGKAERKAPGRRAVGAVAGPAHCGLSAASPAASRPLLIRAAKELVPGCRSNPRASCALSWCRGWLAGQVDGPPVGWARMLGSPRPAAGPKGRTRWEADFLMNPGGGGGSGGQRTQEGDWSPRPKWRGQGREDAPTRGWGGQ